MSEHVRFLVKAMVLSICIFGPWWLASQLERQKNESAELRAKVARLRDAAAEVCFRRAESLHESGKVTEALEAYRCGQAIRFPEFQSDADSTARKETK